MRSPADGRKRLVAFALFAILVVLAPSWVSAATTQSDLVLIREGDVVPEDLYAAGNNIRISGRIEGDLVASSFGELRIDGVVEGSVTAIASSVVISGVVDGSVRVVARDVVVEGTIGEDLAVIAATATTTNSASIGRDVVAAVWRADLNGSIGRGFEGYMRNARLSARVGGNVEIDVRSLTVSDTARVDGDLAFRSSREAVIDEAAIISGSVLDRRPLATNVRVVGLGLLVRVLLIVFGTGLGLAMVWAATERAVASARVLGSRAPVALGQGLAIVALPFVLVAGVVAVGSVMSPEAALPVLGVSLPLGLALAGALVLAALVSPVPPAIFIGRKLAPSRSPYAQFLAGFVVLVVLVALPVVGRFFLAAVVVAGIGGWITSERPAGEMAGDPPLVTATTEN